MLRPRVPIASPTLTAGAAQHPPRRDVGFGSPVIPAGSGVRPTPTPGRAPAPHGQVKRAMRRGEQDAGGYGCDAASPREALSARRWADDALPSRIFSARGIRSVRPAFPIREIAGALHATATATAVAG
ncbi:hypothetical protein SEVIR_2G348350v4 [Setaria viridis]